MLRITKIAKPAERAGFRVGDTLCSLGGYPVLDTLDYIYYDSESRFSACVIRDGKEKKLRVYKKTEESLGLEFDSEMAPIRCKNKCVFCFVDQLPKNLRKTLYVKDDDYRLSFISGSYVTMTNVSEAEIERIIRLKLSPLYISVHAYTDEIRLKLVGNPATLKLINLMRRLGDNGIAMHTQLVIVPDINDGAEIETSIRGLRSVTGVETVAVVPVGLTGHRSGLYDLRAVTPAEAAETIDAVEALNAEYNGFCWCADEYYLKAGRPIPEYEYYGEFEQIENGVGLIADFDDNFRYALSTETLKAVGKKLAFITGVSFAPLLETYVERLDAAIGTSSKVFAVKNLFFGESVTVAGLVTAGDIISQIDATGFDAVVIPDNMLREFGDVFLDDVTVRQTEQRLGAPIITVSHNGSDTARKIVAFFGGGR